MENDDNLMSKALTDSKEGWRLWSHYFHVDRLPGKCLNFVALKTKDTQPRIIMDDSSILRRRGLQVGF